MTTNAFKDIEKLEADLWEAADNPRLHPLSFAAMLKTLHAGLFDT